jgi:hypothetical protein
MIPDKIFIICMIVYSISPFIIVFLCHLWSEKFDKSNHSLHWSPRIFPTK